MENKIFGYARVSTKEQNEGRQIKAIKDYCKSSNLELNDRDILIDKASGKDFDRPQYQLLKQMVRKGDVIIVKSMDRLGRNKEQIKKELEWFKNKDIAVKILDIPTTLIDLSSYDEGMAKAIMNMINNVLIEVLATISEEERNKIRQRQAEGIELAKAQGKHLGRPNIEYPSNWQEVYNDWKNKKITGVKAMDLLGLKKNTFYRLIKKYEEEL